MGPIGIGITKGLPYTIFMKQIIYEITERGQLHQLQKKWKVPKPQCHSKRKKGKPLSIEKLISAFMISLLGIIISFVLLIFEKIFHTKSTNSKQMKHLTIKEANLIKLKRFFNKLENNLKNEEVFPENEMETLLKEMNNHNTLINDTL